MSTRRPGFTLVELLVVVVILGVLASIAIGRYGSSKEKAYSAAMRCDLRNLATLQEAYFAENGSAYASTTSALGSSYRVSSGVTITLSDVTASGWTATASHIASAKTCTISLGVGSTSDAPSCD